MATRTRYDQGTSMSSLTPRRTIVDSVLALVGIEPARRRVVASRSPEAIASLLDRLIDQVRRRVEPAVVDQMKSIASSINQVLPVLARGTMQMDTTSLTIGQVATDFLPTALNAYLAIPAGQRRRRVTLTERTPLEDLQQRLAIIDGILGDIAFSVRQNDLRGLLDKSRILKERLVSPTLFLAD